MSNSISISREYWPEVTDEPHFIISIDYEGCCIKFDDIYFKGLDDVITRLEALKDERKGGVTLNGGFRFNASIEPTHSGAIQFKFFTESSADFPGRLCLEGYSVIPGEDATRFTGSLIRLFRDGKALNLSLCRY